MESVYKKLVLAGGQIWADGLMQKLNNSLDKDPKGVVSMLNLGVKFLK